MSGIFDPVIFDPYVFDNAPYTGSFTADAWFFAPRFFADAVIRKPDVTPTGLSADACFKVNSGTKTFTADAVLLGAFRGDAVIRKPDVTPTGFSANATFKINRSSPGWFPALTADACIKATMPQAWESVMVWGDLFARTTTAPPFNLGNPDVAGTGPYVWTDADTNYTALTSPTHVDGSEAYLDGGSGTYDSFRGGVKITKGDVYFDLWVPASGYSPEFVYHDDGWYLDIYGGGNMYVAGHDNSYNATLTRNAFAHFHVQVDSSIPLVQVRAWNTGDPEPGTWTMIQNTWPCYYYFLGWWSAYIPLMPILDISWVPATQVWKFDNYYVYGQVKSTFHFSADAWILGTVHGTFTADAWIASHLFTSDAIVKRTIKGSFLAQALISQYPHSFTADAVIMPRLLADAVIYKPNIQPTGFTADAYIRTATGTQTRQFTADAVVHAVRTGTLSAGAWLVGLVTTSLATFSADAVVVGAAPAGAFDADAVIAPFPSFTADADIVPVGEKRGALILDATVRRTQRGSFLGQAVIGAGPSKQYGIMADAFIQGWFRADAVIVGTRPGGSFTADAHFYRAWSFHADAVIWREMSHSFSADAMIANANGALGTTTGWLSSDAVIHKTVTGSFLVETAYAWGFTADAVITRRFFTADAVIRGPSQQGSFSADAYIRANTVIVFPPGGGTPVDLNGDPLPPNLASLRKYAIAITVDGVDVTGDVEWRGAEFNAQAKTGPGTFVLPMRGAQPYVGGEEVVLEIDGKRAFAGYVTNVDQTYDFLDIALPKTILSGVDFNILFDWLVVWNKPSTDAWYAAHASHGGPYTNFLAFAQGTMDRTIIEKVCSTYMMMPADVDYSTGVDAIATPAPQVPWAMPEAGSPFRAVMQSISQLTDAVWFFDPYKRLQYHSRYIANPNLPPITDTGGGISCRNATLSSDISQMVTDDWLWGTLASLSGGKIMYTHHYSHVQAEYGFWQWGEWRAEINHANWLSYRAGSIITKYGNAPIKRATCTIFDPGYGAGDVVTFALNAFGTSDILVIRQERITFVSVFYVGGQVYGLPQYDLTLGLDPEAPWNIYDFLPYPVPK